MEEYTIPDDDGKGFTKVFDGGDIEFTDPIQYYGERQKNKIISLEKHLLHVADPIKASGLSDAFFVKRANEAWDNKYGEIIKTAIPPNFIALLNSQSKKEQEKLLKGQSLTPDQLIAFIFKAWIEFGFSFSNYKAEHHHKGLDESALPNLINIQDDGTVKTAGETTLTEGQLRNVISQRKVTIAKFLDKGNAWHCFFTVYRSLRGEESWKDGQPHLHYISDKWGISREDAVRQLKSDKYPTTNIHIDLLDYGGKPIAPKK